MQHYKIKTVIYWVFTIAYTCIYRTTAIQALCIAFSSFSRLCFSIYFALYSVYIFTFAVSISFLSPTNNLAA